MITDTSNHGSGLVTSSNPNDCDNIDPNKTTDDYPEIKKTEKALRETSDYLEKLIDYTNAPFIAWNPDFTITRVNNAFEHLSGYTSDELVYKKLQMLFPESSMQEILNKIGRTLDGEYWKSVEIPIIHKDGSARHILWNSANLYGEDGTTMLVTIAQGIDITKRKHAEGEILRQIEELKRWHDVTLDREDRVQELKCEVNELLIQLNKPIRYPSQNKQINESHISNTTRK